MRRTLFWFGWAVLCALPIALTVEIIRLDDLPHIQIWKWAVLAGAVLLIYFSRNRDDVLSHHIKA